MTKRPLVLAMVGLTLACSGSQRTERHTPPSHELPEDVRQAYVSESAQELRRLLANRLIDPGLREALELSMLLSDGACQTTELGQALERHPTWVGFLEQAHCLALQGRERDALESFVRAVDRAQDPDELEYILRRVCRAADQTELDQIDVMCVGE